MSNYLKIVYFVALCLAIGFFSGKITQTGVQFWYPDLKKPFFNPPSWVFAPVWTLLYIAMGVAAGLVWQQLDKKSELVKKALFMFVIQLALNALWSYLFFGLQNILLAFIEIILLLLVIYETYFLFKQIHKKAGYLMLPYLFWVGFATILTGSIYWLNR